MEHQPIAGPGASGGGVANCSPRYVRPPMPQYIAESLLG